VSPVRAAGGGQEEQPPPKAVSTHIPSAHHSRP
jgi:hypothetical protein